MKKRWAGLLVSLALSASLASSALAAGAEGMTDIAGHWGEADIAWTMENGLFYGVSSTEFAPDESMNRAMFITVLGRMIGIEESEYRDWYLDNLFEDVSADSYYAPYVNWAARYGIAYGTGDGTFSPDQPITREQMACFVVRLAQIYQYEIAAAEGPVTDAFADADDISDFAVDAVEAMRSTGILIGWQDEAKGLSYFSPQATATRAEAAAVFHRLTDALSGPEEGAVGAEPEAVTVYPDSLELWVGSTEYLYGWVEPWNSGNRTLIWVSSDPSVAKVTLDGKVTAVGAGTAEIYCYAANGTYATCTVTCAQRPVLGYAGESYEEKCIRVFGQVVEDPRLVYSNDAQAKTHMVTITVPTWDFADSSHTSKVTKYRTLTVHENIASTVQAIFQEIYNGSEKFPISDIGGYSYRATKSEHSSGLAIDINVNSNYYCDPSGAAITGSHWTPGSDPYSIPIGGDVDQAFAKYGFKRGIYWSSGYKDYMHYSYFGT